MMHKWWDRTKWSGNRSRKHLIYKYIWWAEKRGHLFNLDDAELETLFRSPCYYCGSPPRSISNVSPNLLSYVYNGIDRKDNTVGYVAYNVVTCCTQCNWMKGTKSHAEFMEWLHHVVEYWWLKPMDTTMFGQRETREGER